MTLSISGDIKQGRRRLEIYMFQGLGKKNCTPELLAQIADVIETPVAITKKGEFGVYDHRIIYVNSAFCELTGYSEHELIGRSPDVLCDLRESGDKMTQFYRECSASDKFRTNIKGYQKTGQSFDLELTANPVFSDAGVLVNSLLVCQKRSDAAKAQEVAPVIQNFVQPQQQPQQPLQPQPTKSEAQTKLEEFNYNKTSVSLDEVRQGLLKEMGQNLAATEQTQVTTQHGYEKEYDSILEEIAAELRNIGSYEQLENEQQEQEGDDHNFDGVVVAPTGVIPQPLEPQLSERTNVLENMISVIGRKTEEAASAHPQIAEAKKESITGEKFDSEYDQFAKSRFLSNMSHDLRTPLNAIIGFSEVIRDQLFGPIDNPRYISYASDIYRSGQELLATVSELLELSEVEPQDTTLEEEEFDLSGVIEEVMDLLSARAFQCDVKIMKRLEAYDVTFVGDRRKIKQSIAGIIGNAIKCSPSGGKLEITSEVTIDGEFKFVTYIKSANLIATRSSLGSLLGTVTTKVENEYPEIALAHRFTEAHGGRFSIFNSATSGTEITMVLPVERIVQQEKKPFLKVIN